MLKKKTNKTAAKRFRRTAAGKIKHAKAGRSHLLSGKSRARKRRLRKGGVLGSADARRVGALLSA